jgi:hypothetical protein
VGGTLSLAETRGGAVSGGFIADSVVELELIMTMQQQHLVRNSRLLSGQVGTFMSYVFTGVQV